MTYKPMTDEEWAKLLGDDYPNGLYYGFYGHIEQAVLARIESQGLVIVPKVDAVNISPECVDENANRKHDAERVALIQRIDNHMVDNSDLFDLLRDIRAYLQGGA